MADGEVRPAAPLQAFGPESGVDLDAAEAALAAEPAGGEDRSALLPGTAPAPAASASADVAQLGTQLSTQRTPAYGHSDDNTRLHGFSHVGLVDYRLKVARSRKQRRRMEAETEPDPEAKELHKMRSIFDEMDIDKSGALSQDEIKRLVRSMGDRMSTSELMAAMAKMDPDMTGEVTFERFAKWWKQKKQEYRRELRKRVKEVFELVDTDDSGELSKSEVKKLHSKVLRSLPGTIEFYPPFDLEEDFILMQAEGLRSPARVAEVGDRKIVNYDEFVEWFKFRTGDDDP